MDNVQREQRREREAFERGLRTAVDVLVDAVDDFDLALAALARDEAAEQVAAGVAASRARVIDRFAQLGFETIAPLGEPFDPHLHQAMAVVSSTEYPEGAVCAVQRRGWRYGSFLVRPAMVMVAAAEPVVATEDAVAVELVTTPKLTVIVSKRRSRGRFGLGREENPWFQFTLHG